MVEQRRHHRYTIKLRVRWSFTDRLLEVSSRDISLGGVFITTSRPAIPSTLVKMSIELPDGLGEVGVAGLVVHYLAGRGMGVEFKTFSPGARTLLRSYLGSLAD